MLLSKTTSAASQRRVYRFSIHDSASNVPETFQLGSTGFRLAVHQEAASKALHWAEVDCQTFGTARRYRDGQVLEIGVGMVPDRWCGFE